MDRIRINALQQAVQEHLAEHGGRNWKLVQSRFPDVKRATFWRAVKAVRAASNAPKAIARTEPSGPAPVYYYPENCEPMVALRELREQVQHADDLIVQSKTLNGAIKNWKMYAKGVGLRQIALRHQYELTERLIEIDGCTLVIKALMDTLEACAPVVRDEVLSRLASLYGRDMTEMHRNVQKAKEEIAKETRSL